MQPCTGQWFCIWAELEVNDTAHGCTTTTYMASSHKGTLLVCDTAPTISVGCTCLIDS